MSIESGAATDVQDRHERTPLILAVLNVEKPISRLLIRLQVDLMAVDHYGRTAVDRLKLLGTDNELLETVCENSRSPAVKNIQRPRLTITSLAKSILDEDAVVEERVLAELFIELGYCVLMVNNQIYASLAFEQCFQFLSDWPRTKCKDWPTEDCRVICTVCPNRFLCMKCMDPHLQGQDLTTCRDHEFMKVVPMIPAQLDEDTRQTWLQTVISEYSE